MPAPAPSALPTRAAQRAAAARRGISNPGAAALALGSPGPPGTRHRLRHPVADMTLPPALPPTGCPPPGQGLPAGTAPSRCRAARSGPAAPRDGRAAERRGSSARCWAAGPGPVPPALPSAPHRRPGGLGEPGSLPARPAAALTRAAAASPSRLRSGFLRATRARRAAASTMPAAAAPLRGAGCAPPAETPLPAGPPGAAGAAHFRVPARGRAVAGTGRGAQAPQWNGGARPL